MTQLLQSSWMSYIIKLCPTFCHFVALLFAPALTAVLAEELLEVVTHLVADDGHDVFCRHRPASLLQLK